MSRNLRQNKILELISLKEIDTQEELCNELNSLNFLTTQATISRDIKELGLIKIAGKAKKYKYAYVEHKEQIITNKIINLFRESIINIKLAQNLVVIKTLSGNGSSAGMAVDKLNIPQIIGSVAGDDTLLIIASCNEDAKFIVQYINDLLK